MSDQFDCGICYEIMYQAVSLMPCLHSFCGGCFSDWMVRHKDCPNCREPVNEVRYNASLNSTIDSFIELNPDKKRDPSLIEEL